MGLSDPALAAVFGALVTSVATYIREEWFSKPDDLERAKKKLATSLELEIESIYNICKKYKPNKFEDNKSEPPIFIPIGKYDIIIYTHSVHDLNLFDIQDASMIIQYYRQVIGLINCVEEQRRRWDSYAIYKRQLSDFGNSDKEIMYRIFDFNNITSAVENYLNAVIKMNAKVIAVLHDYIGVHESPKVSEGYE